MGNSIEIKPSSKPVKQNLHWFDARKNRVVREEVAKILAVGFIKEIHHPVAHPVLVKKNKGKSMMFVGYTGLNKSCPKDPYLLCCIDQVVDSMTGWEILYFLDVYCDLNEGVRLARYFIHNPIWLILSHNNAIWVKESWCHLSKVHAVVSPHLDQAQHRVLCGKRRDYVQNDSHPH